MSDKLLEHLLAVICKQTLHLVLTELDKSRASCSLQALFSAPAMAETDTKTPQNMNHRDHQVQELQRHKH